MFTSSWIKRLRTARDGYFAELCEWNKGVEGIFGYCVRAMSCFCLKSIVDFKRRYSGGHGERLRLQTRSDSSRDDFFV